VRAFIKKYKEDYESALFKNFLFSKKWHRLGSQNISLEEIEQYCLKNNNSRSAQILNKMKENYKDKPSALDKHYDTTEYKEDSVQTFKEQLGEYKENPDVEQPLKL